MLSLIVERALRGEASPRADLDFLEDSPALDELVEAAHLVTTKCASRVFNFCTIVNAKSGRCAEDCRWCSQSSKWTTNAPVFPIVPATRGESAAARALEHGIRRLSFVTSGRKLSARELREIRPVVEAAASTGLEVCASMGLLTEPELTGLREAGLVRYHCNLETGPDFFPKVCTTHTQTDKIRTLEAARRAGLELCSGGLFGMGETMADRIDLACGLRRLEIPSIPLNFLIPIPGTPLADRPAMTHDEVVRTVAVFRLVNPSACLRFGRQAEPRARNRPRRTARRHQRRHHWRPAHNTGQLRRGGAPPRPRGRLQPLASETRFPKEALHKERARPSPRPFPNPSHKKHKRRLSPDAFRLPPATFTRATGLPPHLLFFI